ncbi:MAG TPA: dihydroxyacetone kinase subunit DhaK [Chloroflexi bacterium]|nr:dihydroxyacetone kinase subunit DhaK [Chloroflexota bacterium]
MKKIINDPMAFVDETLEGILAAHPGQLKAAGDPRAIVRADAPVEGKVAIVTGGGSGHLPVFLGYVGRGLCDGVAVGNVFSSPSAETMYEATLATHGGVGVLYLYGNYSGDVMNFDMAAEMAAMDDIRVETVLVSDDVASAPREDWTRRRGIAGLFFAYKVAGACADGGADLDEVVRQTRHAVENTATMGVALSPCTVPAAGVPTFTLGENEMEIGMGIHGEAGVRRGPLDPADAIAEALTGAVIGDLSLGRGDRVAVLVNGLGATPVEELYILYRRMRQILDADGIGVHRSYIGEYATSLEMAGASISLLKLDDDLTGLLDAPASSPFFVQAADLGAARR